MTSGPSWVGDQTLPPGSLFHGKYQILRLLAQGGMGAVYEVLHVETQRRRALKIMLPALVHNDELRDRFRIEARVAAGIDSEHVVETFDAGVDVGTGMPFLVMELLNGEPLSAFIRRGRAPVDTVLTLLDQVSTTLDKTHAAHVVHRDLKPENLFVVTRNDGSYRVKILDFGIAKIIEQTTKGMDGTRSIGTPLYMAPEQIDAETPISPQTDLYALGQITFTLLAGREYWAAEHDAAPTVYAFMLKVAQGPLVPASQVAQRSGITLPPAFDSWFSRATARDARTRFPSATEQHSALVRAISQASTQEEPRADAIILGVEPLSLRAQRAGTLPTPSPAIMQVTSVVPRTQAPRTRRRWGRIVTIVLLLLMGGAGGATFVAYRAATKERAAINAEMRAVKGSDEEVAPTTVSSLAKLEQREKDLEAWVEQGPPLLLSPFFDAKTQLRRVQEARNAPVQAWRARVIEELDRDMKAIDGRDYLPQFETLKLYLALGAAERVTKHREFIRGSLAPRVLHTSDEADPRVPFLELIIDGFAAEPLRIDEGSVSAARVKLSTLEPAYYALLVTAVNFEQVEPARAGEEAPLRYPAATVASIFSAEADVRALLTSKDQQLSGKPIQIDGAFTAAGRARVMENLEHAKKGAKEDDWVMERPVLPMLKSLQQVRARYESGLSSAWRQLFMDIEVRASRSLSEFVDGLKLLASGSRPYEKLFGMLDEVTRSSDPEDPVRKRFAPWIAFGVGKDSNLAKYLALIGRLQAELRTKAASRLSKPPTKEDIAAVEAVRVEVEVLLLPLPVDDQYVIKSMLLDPLKLYVPAPGDLIPHR